ncbi:hypothetical protein GWI33_016915 [Rhynchophorus ferrugineus]|uniref:[acyl-carrier-protein] S-malonyltransferase n=1 Tax=Rhynchophorus ferrugineus TaxID=354439 RepID=A0A834I2V2_RHYFE|nr:hypothetical protein GWI33_016915 [Rhynchophorus ferrugineus]
MSLFLKSNIKLINVNKGIGDLCSSYRTFFTYTALLNNSKNSDESPLKRLLNDASSFDGAKITNPEQQWATAPYPHKPPVHGTKEQIQGDYYKTEKKDPRDSTIIVFPGQGSQYVGMAKDLMKYPMAKDLFDLASYILKYDLLKLCLEGPADQLNDTRYCQPAVMVSSLAALEKLKEERPNALNNCVATAGFSLGELTALVFAGSIQFENAIKLVQIRAEAMKLAADTCKGGMMTVMFGPDSKVNYACKIAKDWAMDKGDEYPECRIANYLYPHCKVISGSESALDYMEKNYKEYKIKKVKRLPVSGAFHSDHMIQAVSVFRRALKKTDIQDPIIRVYSNVDGKRYRNANHIREQLPKQIVKPVKWEQLLHVVYERDPGEYFPQTYECGPGHSLKTILKQVNAKAWDHCFNIEA